MKNKQVDVLILVGRYNFCYFLELILTELLLYPGQFFTKKIFLQQTFLPKLNFRRNLAPKLQLCVSLVYFLLLLLVSVFV